MMLHSNLSYKHHIKSILSKVNKTIGISGIKSPSYKKRLANVKAWDKLATSFTLLISWCFLLRYLNIEPGIKLWWYRTRDFYGSQIPMTLGLMAYWVRQLPCMQEIHS